MQVRLRDATEADSEFCYRVKKAAHLENVVATYGTWEEGFQRAYHDKQWSPSGVRVIVADDSEVGWLWSADEREHISIKGLYVLPAHQRRGIGTEVVQRLLAEAEAVGKTVRLHVMKRNSASTFYRKLGFIVVGEGKTHFEMRGKP